MDMTPMTMLAALASLWMTTMTHAVIVIDDDPNIRKIYSSLLSKEGYDVDVAETIAQAEPMFAAKRYAVAVVDWMLPGESGESFINRFDFCTTVPLLVTAHGITDDKVVAMMENGLLFALSKPVPVRKLVACVKSACQLHVLRQSNLDITEVAGDMIQAISDAENDLRRAAKG
jgi:DNA-binding response OmpR family regulator